MKNNPSPRGDKPLSDELTKTPLVNPYGYLLWDELTKLQRSNNNNKIAISRRKEITKTLLDIYSSPKGSLIATQIWHLKAFTTKELMKLTGFSSRVIDYTRKNLIRVDLIRKAVEVNLPYGQRGPKPWIYSVGTAVPQDIAEAKLRYEGIVKKEREKDKALKREELLLAAEARRLKSEAEARLKGTLVQTLVTEFVDLFQRTKKPVSLQEIDKKAKSVGLSDSNAFLKIAVKLEEQGILTWSYLNGEPDPHWKIPSQIRRVREAREGQL